MISSSTPSAQLDPAFTELRRRATDVPRDLSLGAGVLVPDSDPSAGRNVRYLFLHRTVAEYLTARDLATLPEADWLAIVGQHQWFDPDWAQVIPMLGERLSPRRRADTHPAQHLLAEVPRTFRTVHPLGWTIWKGETFAPTEEKASHRNSRTKP